MAVVSECVRTSERETRRKRRERREEKALERVRDRLLCFDEEKEKRRRKLTPQLSFYLPLSFVRCLSFSLSQRPRALALEGLHRRRAPKRRKASFLAAQLRFFIVGRSDRSIFQTCPSNRQSINRSTWIRASTMSCSAPPALGPWPWRASRRPRWEPRRSLLRWP